MASSVKYNDHLTFTSPLREERPVVSILPKYLVVYNYFDNRYFTLHSSFTPAEREAENEMNQAFYKNAFERPKDFIYGGLPVYERFQSDFDTISALEDELEQDQVDNEEELEDAIELAKSILRENIKVHFLEFLQTELGHERMDQIPEILFRLSQKAITSTIAELNTYTQKSFSSILSGSQPVKQRIELHIPSKESNDSVKIISTTNTIFDRQHAPQQSSVQLDAAIQLVAKGVFSIPSHGSTQADVELSLGV
jgi:hypothetical protein